jgi:hypothetical protein
MNIAGVQLDQNYDAPPCEWRCLLWLAEHHRHRAVDASQHALNPVRQMGLVLDGKRDFPESQADYARFVQVVRDVLDEAFSANGLSCPTKNFQQCPYLENRALLMKQGAFASELLTVLQKAVHLSMLVKYPLDSGLRADEFRDVLGIDLTNFSDLSRSFDDGRFQRLLANVKAGYQRFPHRENQP